MKKFLLIILIMLLIPFFCLAKEVKAPKKAAPPTQINVAFTIDNNYPYMALVTMDSILEQNITKSKYTFYIIENNMTDKNKKMMERYVKSKKQRIEFINVDTKRIDKGDDLFSYLGRLTSIAFARILLPELLPKTVHKVIYMDADTLVVGDLKELYTTNLGNYNAGLVLNHEQWNSSLPLYKFKHGYYNSGVILFNLDKCRRDKSADKMLTFLEKHKNNFVRKGNESYAMKFKYPDQDLINIVWDGKIKTLPKKWNNQCATGRCFAFPMYENMGIIHYIGPHKPWSFLAREKRFEYNMEYTKSLKRPALRKCRYYFAYKRYVDDYKYFIKKKIRRYKNIYEMIMSKDKFKSPFMRFFVPGKENTGK